MPDTTKISALATPEQIPARSLFLAGPFTAQIDPKTGSMRALDRARFESLIEFFELKGYHVYNAHRREAWGAQLMSPEECTRLDYDNIASADLLVAFPGNPASPGTHVELGWASALGKPIILLLETGVDYAFLVRGLHTVAKVIHVTLADASGHFDALERALATLRS